MLSLKSYRRLLYPLFFQSHLDRKCNRACAFWVWFISNHPLHLEKPTQTISTVKKASHSISTYLTSSRRAHRRHWFLIERLKIVNPQNTYPQKMCYTPDSPKPLLTCCPAPIVTQATTACCRHIDCPPPLHLAPPLLLSASEGSEGGGEEPRLKKG
jgi:hypothetical protein